jgi:hypothetical protein
MPAAAADWPGCQVQNLHYTYDPAGNITHIHDDAQQTIYFKDKRVEPSNDYTYDALYRLIQAKAASTWAKARRSRIPQRRGRVSLLSAIRRPLRPNDGNTMGTTTERYVYGNRKLLEMQHGRRYVPAGRGTFMRTALEGSAKKQPPEPHQVETAADHYHPTLTAACRMPHLGGGRIPIPTALGRQDQYDDLGGGGTAYYAYDAAGQRCAR